MIRDPTLGEVRVPHQKDGYRFLRPANENDLRETWRLRSHVRVARSRIQLSVSKHLKCVERESAKVGCFRSCSLMKFQYGVIVHFRSPYESDNRDKSELSHICSQGRIRLEWISHSRDLSSDFREPMDWSGSDLLFEAMGQPTEYP